MLGEPGRLKSGVCWESIKDGPNGARHRPAFSVGGSQPSCALLEGQTVEEALAGERLQRPSALFQEESGVRARVADVAEDGHIIAIQEARRQ